MVTVYDVDAQELINKAADELKKVDSVKAPSWSIFVKTGQHNERGPSNPDWWHIRTAAVLRTVYVQGPIGVSKLRRKYGGDKTRGVRPKHARRASGNIIRKCLQQLQKAGLVEYREKGVRKGRVISGKGKSLLDNLSKEICKSVSINSAPNAQ